MGVKMFVTARCTTNWDRCNCDIPATEQCVGENCAHMEVEGSLKSKLYGKPTHMDQYVHQLAHKEGQEKGTNSAACLLAKLPDMVTLQRC